MIDGAYWGALLALHGHPAADSWKSLSAKRDKSGESLRSRAPRDSSAVRGQAGDGVTHSVSWAALVSLHRETGEKEKQDAEHCCLEKCLNVNPRHRCASTHARTQTPHLSVIVSINIETN